MSHFYVLSYELMNLNKAIATNMSDHITIKNFKLTTVTILIFEEVHLEMKGIVNGNQLRLVFIVKNMFLGPEEVPRSICREKDVF